MMKKFIALITLVCTLAFAGVCLAGENGTALNKAERTVDKLIDSLDTARNIGYSDIAKGFSADLQQKVSAAGLAALQKQIGAQFGKLNEYKMVSFERFDQGDRAIYLAGFSREKVVRMVFVFDKDGKMNDFAFTPVNVEQAGK